MSRHGLVLLLTIIYLTPSVQQQQQQQQQPSQQAEDAQQRAALLTLSNALGIKAANLQPTRPGQQAWGASNSNYCNWRGVVCCANAAALLPLPCGGDSDVVGLNLTEAGLQGSLPAQLDPPLQDTLQMLMMAHNPGLAREWPPGLLLPRLAVLDVHNTSLVACQDSNLIDSESAAAEDVVAAPCRLPAAFSKVASEQQQTTEGMYMICPQLQLSISGGAVLADASFIRYSGCKCVHPTDRLETVSAAAAGQLGRLGCVNRSAALYRQWRRVTLLIGVLPTAVFLLAGLFIR